MTDKRLYKYLNLLTVRSECTSNDRAYPKYVEYINGFLEKIGKERVYLVGSTRENLKVRTSKDSGDTDFILLSGKLEIPVKHIRLREDIPWYAWVQVNQEDVDRSVTLIDNIYFPSDVLRNVGPELFTILRGIYLMFTINTDHAIIENYATKFATRSKVGLAVTKYRNFKVDGDILSRTRQLNKKTVLHRDTDFRKYLHQRRKGLQLNEKDNQYLFRALKFLSSTKIPGSSGLKLGHWQHCAYLIDIVLRRSEKDQSEGTPVGRPGDLEILNSSDDDSDNDETNVVKYENNFDNLWEDCDKDQQNIYAERERCPEEVAFKKIRATYTEKTCKDFVPALKISGTLPCIDDWKNMDHSRWLSEEDIEAISKMDVVLVARYAPINPSKKDFCFSFTLAEKKLMECLKPTQHRLVLIMKAYLKGVFTKEHQKRKWELKLTTYHMKTMIFRVSDVTDPYVWDEDNLLQAILVVLDYLKDALKKKELLHYFIRSNLFSDFEDEDFNVLLKCISDIRADPAGSIGPFFNIDDGIPNEIWLSEEEVLNLENMSSDGGISQEADKLEEAILEVQRGLDEGPRDEKGHAPILEAIANIVQLFFQDEVYLKPQKTGERHPNVVNQSPAPLVPALSSFIGGFVASPSREPLLRKIKQLLDSSSREEQRRIEEIVKYYVISYFNFR